MFVPGGVELTFVLTENVDGSVTLTYSTGSTSASVIPTLTLKYPTLAFKDMIRINVFFTAENTQDVMEMGMITYSYPVSRWSVRTAEHVIPCATYDAATGRYYACSQGIHGKYLADTVYLAVYAKLADGSYVYSKLEGSSNANIGAISRTSPPRSFPSPSMLLLYTKTQAVQSGPPVSLATPSVLTAPARLPREVPSPTWPWPPPSTATTQNSISANTDPTVSARRDHFQTQTELTKPLVPLHRSVYNQ